MAYNPMQWTITQWFNFVSFILGSLAMGAWWQVYLEAQTVALITGGLTWLVSVINFMVTGAVAPASVPVSNVVSNTTTTTTV